MTAYAKDFYPANASGRMPRICIWRDVPVDIVVPGVNIAAMNVDENVIPMFPMAVYTITFWAKTGAAPTGATFVIRRHLTDPGAAAFNSKKTALAGSVVYPSFDTIESHTAGGSDGWDWSHLRPELTVESTAGAATVDVMIIQTPYNARW